MSSSTNDLKLHILGKPNSGKSTLFNYLCGENLSPTGDEYGLTKKNFTADFCFNSHKFIINDTPGLRRKNKINDKSEQIRNKNTILILKQIDVALLLVDSIENITKQDFRIIDQALKRKKIVFVVFTKFDLVNDKKNFRDKTKKFLKFNYHQYNDINLEFISVKSKLNINKLLKKIIEKKALLAKKIPKKIIKKFTNKLINENRYPKQGGLTIKSKYIVQINCSYPAFKIFLNTNKKIGSNYVSFFSSELRKYLKLNGVPIDLQFISSKNPYQIKS